MVSYMECFSNWGLGGFPIVETDLFWGNGDPCLWNLPYDGVLGLECM